MRKLVSNRIADATCLIFKAEPSTDGLTGRVEMWSPFDIGPGTAIQSNQSILFVTSDTNKQRVPFRDWEIKEVLAVRDLKGDWSHDKEKKNHQSHYTVNVIPRAKL